MDQKRILWVVAGVGLFLVIVIGAALLLYAPPKSAAATKINSSTLNDTWIVPQQQQQGTVKDLTVISENANVYSESVTTIDLNTLGNNTITSNAESALATTQDPITEVAAVVKPAVQVSRPKATPRPAPKKPAVQKPVAAPSYFLEYWIQAGSYTDRVRADEAREELTKNNYNSEIFTKTIDGVLRYRVRVGPYLKKVEAEDAVLTIKNTTSFEGSFLTSVKINK
ncbi:MAG: SPOR domain-containing protein [Treponemataceae bacterium]